MDTRRKACASYIFAFRIQSQMLPDSEAGYYFADYLKRRDYPDSPFDTPREHKNFVRESFEVDELANLDDGNFIPAYSTYSNTEE